MNKYRVPGNEELKVTFSKKSIREIDRLSEEVEDLKEGISTAKRALVLLKKALAVSAVCTFTVVLLRILLWAF